MKFGEIKGHDAPQKIGFLLLPRFSLMAYACTSEPLRIANWLMNKQLYDWHILTENGNSVTASNRMEITPDHAIQDIDFLPMTITFASHTPEYAVTKSGLSCIVPAI